MIRYLCPHCQSIDVLARKTEEREIQNYDYSSREWVDTFVCPHCDGLSERRTLITGLIPLPHLTRPDSPVA